MDRGRRIHRGSPQDCADCGEYISADQVRHNQARVDEKGDVTHKNHPGPQKPKEPKK